ncbi:MAG: SDR family oxidoreductase [Cytophagales bacterium]|nr:SDR family oxidoreductase [Cytophagales bacterium]
MRVLITGANGLLGQKLISLLSTEPDVELHATGRGICRIPDGNYTYHRVDLTEEGALFGLFEQERPHAVIHGAAMTNVDACEEDPKECELQNVTVVESLIRACENHSTFMTLVSTDFIFDGENGPYSEEDKPNPLSAYGHSKLKAEEALRKSTLDWAIARTILVYGVIPDASRSNIVLWTKKSLEDGKPLQLINDQWRMPTLAEDLAMGCWLMTKQQAKGVFNISGKDLLNPYEIALKTAAVFGLDASLVSETDGSKFTQPAKRPPRTGFKLKKSMEVLGYHPSSFEEGLEILKNQLS